MISSEVSTGGFVRGATFVLIVLASVVISTVERVWAQTNISFVQVNSAVPQSAQSSVSVTYSAAQGAGDLNVIVVGWNDATGHVLGVTDTKGNSYALAVGPT